MTPERKTEIKVNGDVVGQEVKTRLIQTIGREPNKIDNMSRKFKFEGVKAKLDMWDVLTLIDTKKKNDDDNKFATELK